MEKTISAKIVKKVPFYDVDPMNVVWHGNYIKYFEEARCEFFKEIKYTYEDMQKDGIMYPVAKLEVKYVKSAHFGEEIEISCTLAEIEPAIIFKYEIKDLKTKDIIASAKTMQMGVKISTKETSLEINENFRRKIDEYKN